MFLNRLEARWEWEKCVFNLLLKKLASFWQFHVLLPSCVLIEIFLKNFYIFGMLFQAVDFILFLGLIYNSFY